MDNPFKIIDERLNRIEQSLIDLKNKKEEIVVPEIELPITIKQVAELTSLSVSTIYIYVQRRSIPFNKRFGRLYFFKSSIVEFIKTGNQLTLNEISDKADEYIKTKKLNETKPF